MDIGRYLGYSLKPTIFVHVSADDLSQSFSHNAAPYPNDKYSKEIVPIDKSFDVGPVKKKKPQILIRVDDQYSILKPEFQIEGNIYELWKNGYTPQHPDYFVDVFFSWCLQPQQKN